jgi:hypothetical protein
MPVFEKKTRKFAKGGKTTASMIELPNCNILVKGISKDVNGNKTVLLTFPNGPAFSIQTNGDLPFTHKVSTAKGIKDDLSYDDMVVMSREICDYVSEYGSKLQKSKLRTYNKFEKGGKVKGYHKLSDKNTIEKVSKILGKNPSSEYVMAFINEELNLDDEKEMQIASDIVGYYKVDTEDKRFFDKEGNINRRWNYDSYEQGGVVSPTLEEKIAKMEKALNNKSLSDAQRAGFEKAIANAKAKLAESKKEEPKAKSKKAVDYADRRKEIEQELKKAGYSLELDMGGEGSMLIDKDGELADYDKTPDYINKLHKEYNEISDSNFNAYSKVTGNNDGSKPKAKAKTPPKSVKPKAKPDTKKDEEPDCDELLTRYKEAKKSRKRAAGKPKPTPGQKVEKTMDKVAETIEKNDGKVNKQDQGRIKGAIKELVESIKDNKVLIRELIAELKKLL